MADVRASAGTKIEMCETQRALTRPRSFTLSMRPGALVIVALPKVSWRRERWSFYPSALAARVSRHCRCRRVICWSAALKLV